MAGSLRRASARLSRCTSLREIDSVRTAIMEVSERGEGEGAGGRGGAEVAGGEERGEFTSESP